MTNVARTMADPRVYGLPFLLAFALSVVMLVTDKNLQTDFGSVPAYYAHWYVVLATAVLDLVGAALLLAVRGRTVFKVGVIGSGLLALLFVADIFTYSQVGFSSASAFANYLFGVTYFGGDVRYLYDVLLAVYVATFLWGAVALALTRATTEPRTAPEAATKSTP